MLQRMSNKKLLAPLSAILRRTLTPTTTLFTFNSSRNFQSPAFFSPKVETDRRLFPLGRFDFPGDHRIPGKCFVSSQSVEEADAKCWNCSASGADTVPFLLCSSCRCIQPVDQSLDYFQIFGLYWGRGIIKFGTSGACTNAVNQLSYKPQERKYDSKVDDLEGKYKAWQKKLHPDLVHTKSEKEREYAAEQSARVIDAYRTLSQPLARAIYMMKLEGVDVDEEETLSESDLLTEILEIREAVEEAADSQALDEIQSQMKEKLKHWSDAFANAFHSRNFGEALKAIRRMTYYERVNESVVKKQ
ncbi:iron-sulfur cluster co-chaperone protein HscB homolog isoform X1 [Malus domestica]|uniref:iron-sulfur cluster co-chaperone protein HscB homolog isoform X1 n=1 Tax=Malus domestica TaxID=3750 RepID=UPI0039751430